jgi:hypothetical protein
MAQIRICVNQELQHQENTSTEFSSPNEQTPEKKSFVVLLKTF